MSTAGGATAPEQRSWAPMMGLFLAQVLMFFMAALPISLGGMVEEFGIAPTVDSSTIVLYGLAVAALVMTGAKLGQRIGWRTIFGITLAIAAAVFVLSFGLRADGAIQASASTSSPRS